MLTQSWRACRGHVLGRAGGCSACTRAYGTTGSSSASKGVVGIGHVVVIGGGAIGSLFAARLSTLKDLSGRVWLLTGWKEHAEAISQTHGVIINEAPSVGGSCLVGAVRVATRVSEILQDSRADEEAAKGQINVVIVAVKQRQIRKASEDAAALLSKSHGGVLLALQNGVGHMDVLRKTIR